MDATEVVTVSELSQPQKDKYCMFPSPVDCRVCIGTDNHIYTDGVQVQEKFTSGTD